MIPTEEAASAIVWFFDSRVSFLKAHPALGGLLGSSACIAISSMEKTTMHPDRFSLIVHVEFFSESQRRSSVFTIAAAFHQIFAEFEAHMASHFHYTLYKSYKIRSSY